MLRVAVPMILILLWVASEGEANPEKSARVTISLDRTVCGAVGPASASLVQRPGSRFVDVDILVEEIPSHCDDHAIEAVHAETLEQARRIWKDAVVGRLRVCEPSGSCQSVEALLELPKESLAAAASAYRRAATSRPLASERGVLSGKKIVVSPGHGYNWSNNAWGFQRGITCRLREDIHTNQIVMDELLPALTRAGALVVSVRERSYATDEAILYPPVHESGHWEQIGGGFEGPAWRCRAEAGPCEAYWTFVPNSDDAYSLDAFFVPQAGGAGSAVYRVLHPSGVTAIPVNQAAAKMGAEGRWVPLGLFDLRAGEPVHVSVSAEEGILFADAIRFGGGMGSADFGGGPSGVPRWQESARAHLTALKAPSFVVGAGSNDVVARPLYALFLGADLFLSIHTNAFNGSASGTSTYVWHHDYCPGCGLKPIPEELPPGTLTFASLLHGHVLKAVRDLWKEGWPDQKLQGSNFGELRPLAQTWAQDPNIVVPGALIEIAFHDNCSVDAVFLRERSFRRDVARAMLKAVVDFFRDPSDEPRYPPLPPRALSAVTSGTEVVLSWLAEQDPLHPEASRPERYHVYRSVDGRIFHSEPVITSATSVHLPVEPCEPVFFKVTAVNVAGESSDSAVVGVLGALQGGARVLVVDGMDRFVQTVEDPTERPTLVPLIVNTLQASGLLASRLVIESATDDAVGQYLDLSQYDAILWFTGETSTRDQAITPGERDRLADYLDAGGSLLLSGSEIAWYLGVTSKEPEDATFLATFLHTSYTAAHDNAGVSSVDAVHEGPLAGLPFHEFGTGQGSSYLCEYPDVLPPAPGAFAAAHYSGDRGVAVVAYPQNPGSQMRLIYAGYPIETISNNEVLKIFLERSLAFLVPGLETAAPVTCSTPPPDIWTPEDVGHDAGIQEEDAAPCETTTQECGACECVEAHEPCASCPETVGSCGDSLGSCEVPSCGIAECPSCPEVRTGGGGCKVRTGSSPGTSGVLLVLLVVVLGLSRSLSPPARADSRGQR